MIEVIFRALACLLLVVPTSLCHSKYEAARVEEEKPEPEWIWSPAEAAPRQRVFFALSFELDQRAQVLESAFAADNAFKLWLDGELLARGESHQEPTWFQPETKLAKGLHTICVGASNGDGPAGLAGYLQLELADGSLRVFETSSQWTTWDEAPSQWPKLDAPWAEAGTPSRSMGRASTPTAPWGDVFARVQLPDPALFSMPSDFVCEKIYSADRSEGSWASMTFSDDGRLFVSGERGSLLSFRLTEELISGGAARPLGSSTRRGPQVAGISPSEVVALAVHSAQGLEWAHDSLYVVMATNPDKSGGLHRLRDTDGDGVLDQEVLLASFGAQSEHGPHGIRVGPDGMLYLVTGNYTQFPSESDGKPSAASLPDSYPPNSAEDVLLPRVWDPRGHARDIMAPGAQLWRTDKQGRVWEQVASGMRNPYDLAISPAGQVFTYDADMEWDLGAPWYRSPRLLHLVQGGEYGWRAGSAKWPATFADSLPPLAETDLSSPTGVELGIGSAFSSEYQDVVLLGDWAWGRILMAALEPVGASYSSKLVTLLEGRGVAITDLEIGPDGWLWFIIGGRGTQSGLYRVRQVHDQPRSIEPEALPPLHQTLLLLQAEDCTVAKALQFVDSTDRVLAAAARLVLERTSPEQWLPRGAGLAPSLGLPMARAWPKELAASGRDLSGWFGDFGADARASMFAVRAAMVVQMRTPQFANRFRQAWAADLMTSFPTGVAELDSESARLLTSLGVDGLPSLFLPLLHQPQSQETQVHYALLLRMVDKGWTDKLRMTYFDWFESAKTFQGGASLSGFLAAIRGDALERVPKELHEAIAERAKAKTPPTSAASPSAKRPFVRAWTLDVLLQEIASSKAAPKASRGEKIFTESLCIQCHRVEGKGGALGPDLSSAGRRFTERELFRAILRPQDAVSDQYGLIQMPAGLLNDFTATEIADLQEFLEQAAR